jgi:hypothetical protein
MKNIHILPTDQKSRLHCYFELNKIYTLSKEPLNWRTASHIYITSDEEIKQGDWFTSGSLFHKVIDILDCDDDGSLEIHSDGYCNPLSTSKKIVLTTNTDLIADGVQAIDDEFLEWFVKNPSCDFVEVKMEKFGVWRLGYKIIIPQEEPKQDFDRSKYIAGIDPIVEETLEEAAFNFTAGRSVKEVYSKMDFINGAKFGANWQAEKDKNKYSEEEVRQIATWSFHFYKTNEFTDSELEDEWYKLLEKKFKKK